MTDEELLARGLPSAVPRNVRWHALVRRSAPALAAWATLMLLELYVMVASGDQDIDIDTDTDSGTSVADWSVLVVLAALLPAMAVAGYAVSRITSARVRQAVGWVSIVAGLASDTYQADGWSALPAEAVDVAVVLLILAATGSGLGSLLGWALRTTFTHLRSAGQLIARALPVVLLTLLVFFNNTVWYIAANLSTGRVWLLAGCLVVIALAFTVTESVHVCRPLFAPLRRSEHLNVVAVTALAQSIQALVLALVTGAIFFVMGLVVLNDTVLDHLTDGNPVRSHWLDLALPIDQALAHITLILVALTFMYLSARAATDPKHRTEFVDPLLDDLRHTLAADRTAGAKRYPL
jgi:hypothetical protein